MNVHKSAAARTYARLDAFLKEAAADPAGTLLAPDVDGTVSAIALSPKLASVPKSMRATLRSLARKFQLWFLSGRDIEDVRRLVGVPAAGYVGSHGLEAQDGRGRRLLASVGKIDPQLADLVGAVTADVPEVQAGVERKRWGVAFHYRALSSTPDIASRLLRSIEAHLPPDLRLRAGKMVYEAVPAIDCDKGIALRWLLRDRRPRRVLAAGDDLTDVPMFEELRRSRARAGVDGVTVTVLQGHETPAEIVTASDACVEGITGLHQLFADLLRDLPE